MIEVIKIILSEIQKDSVNINSKNVVKNTVILLILSNNTKEIKEQNKYI